MSGGPGGLFPLLRSAAAAEIAKHFGTVEGGAEAAPPSVRIEGAAPQARPVPPSTAPSTPLVTLLTASMPVLSDLQAGPQGGLSADFDANLSAGFTPNLATSLIGLSPPRVMVAALPSSDVAQAPGAPVPDASAPVSPRATMPLLEGGDPVLLAQRAQDLRTTPLTAPTVPSEVAGRQATAQPAQMAVNGGQTGAKATPEPIPAADSAKADRMPDALMGQPLSRSSGLPSPAVALPQPSLPTGSTAAVTQTVGAVAPMMASGQTPLRTESVATSIVSGSGLSPAVTELSPTPASPIGAAVRATDQAAVPPWDLTQQANTQGAASLPNRVAQTRPTAPDALGTLPSARAEPALAVSQTTSPALNAPTPTAPTGQLTAALSPAMAEALVTGGFPLTFGGQAASTASLVIFNAAMIPSWPPALHGDAPQQMEAALRAGGAVMAQMSPAEAAEYLAKMAAAFGFLLTVKKRLAQSLKEEKETLLGLFSFLGVALETLSKGLQMALDLTAEQREMLAELALAQADEGGRPPHKNRQRLRL
jgi:hypothetical protein